MTSQSKQIFRLSLRKEIKTEDVVSEKDQVSKNERGHKVFFTSSI